MSKREIKKITIKEALTKNEINKKDFPDAVYLDKTLIEDGKPIPTSYKNCIWYGLYEDNEIKSVVQVKENEKPVIYIHTLETSKKERNKGYAKAIIEEIKNIYKNKGYTSLELTPMNTYLITFYERLGFNKKNNSKRMETKI